MGFYKKAFVGMSDENFNKGQAKFMGAARENFRNKIGGLVHRSHAGGLRRMKGTIKAMKFVGVKNCLRVWRRQMNRAVIAAAHAAEMEELTEKHENALRKTQSLHEEDMLAHESTLVDTTAKKDEELKQAKEAHAREAWGGCDRRERPAACLLATL